MGSEHADSQTGVDEVRSDGLWSASWPSGHLPTSRASLPALWSACCSTQEARPLDPSEPPQVPVGLGFLSWLADVQLTEADFRSADLH